ncbi:MAG TPA: SDR family oxidoreductase [Acidocella sp.]|jgi:3-oxoacyl-[acyl-carrier protein] reductase|nr:SDR family oxidoreductase [Acidocella sp.]
MDLGLKGRTALVCAASAGLGFGCAEALAREGVAVTISGRDAAKLAAAAAKLRGIGPEIRVAPGDITTEAGRRVALEACPMPDILVNNAGGPPPGDFREFSEAQWLAALNANLLTPIALIRSVLDGMIIRKFGRIVNITSASVKSPIASLPLSNTARTGLTGFVAGVARDVARHNVTINNLLPGPFATDRQIAISAAASKASGKSPEEESAARAAKNPAGRFGTAEEFGAACAFLCSAQAGFIVGQNILLDGGAFNSTM